MSQILSTITVIGIDIGKNSFHVIGLDEHGAPALRQKWSRPERSIPHCCQMPNKAATAGGGATLTAHRPRRRAIDGPGAPG
jgi:hypothetical protein